MINKLTLLQLVRMVRNKVEFYFCQNKFHKSTSSDISFGKGSRFRQCKVVIHGKNNKVIFGKNCNMCGMHILITGCNNTIQFGDNVTINASKFQPTVINAIGGTNITIGSGSLLSNNIEIHSSDYHGIYDKDGKRINPDRDIIIGKHVWIGLGCIVLKGSIVSDDTVIGAGSLISGSYLKKNVILAGIPAKIIKDQVFWNAERKESFTVSNG